MSGSGLPDTRPSLLSDSGSGGKLPDSEWDNLLMYCSDFHRVSNFQY